MSFSKNSVIKQHVTSWLNDFVVGLNLCPFARIVVDTLGLRIIICDSDQLDVITERFISELNFINNSSEVIVPSTLLVVPNALKNFKEYLSFINISEKLVEEMGMEGTIQLASFHPNYQFAGEQNDSVSHYTNRSPYPIIHFLREEMVERALENYSKPEEISQRNIKTLKDIGLAEIERRWNLLK